VAAGATVAVDNGGTLELNDTTGTLNGTVTVGSGGILKDAAGGSLWNNNATGQFVLSPGAKAYLGGGNTPVIGNHANARLTLDNGTITLKADGYVLDGNATLQKAFGLDTGQELIIKADKVLTIDTTDTPPAFGVLNGAIIKGEDGASIVVKSGLIGFQYPGTHSNFYDNATPRVQINPNTSAATYDWNVSTQHWEQR
jgi:hypothetical protein